MFFKKNKSNPTPIDPNQLSTPPESLAGGGSLFAPGLNPSAQPIDFGFGRIPSPPNYAYPESSFAAEAAPPLESVESSAWGPQPVLSESGLEPVPSMPELLPEWLPELLNDTELSASAPAVEQATSLPEHALPDGTGASYLEETFEHYTPNPSGEPIADASESGLGWDSPAQPAPSDWESGLDAQYVTSQPLPPNVEVEMAYPPPMAVEPQSDWSAPAESVPAQSSLVDSGLGDLMPWEQLPPNPTAQASLSPELLWEQFDSGATPPGEQVPTDAGVFLDSVHEKLYPEDPFAPAYDQLLEGQQAFEDAAQFLFPDTVSASIDWQPETALAPDSAQAFSAEDLALLEPPLELGPSVQSDLSEVSDMSAFAADPISASLPSFTPDASEQMAADFASVAEPWDSGDPLAAFDPFATPLQSNVEHSPGSSGIDTSKIPADAFSAQPGLVPFDPLEPDALDFDPFNTPTGVSPVNPADHSISADQQLNSIDSGFGLALPEFDSVSAVPADPGASVQWMPEQPVESASVDSSVLDFDPFGPLPTEVMPGEAPEALMGSSFVPDYNSEHNAGLLGPEDSNASALPVDGSEPTFFAAPSSQIPEQGRPESWAVDPAVQAELLDMSDQDFYATDFTVNEFGELVPVQPLENKVSPDLGNPVMPELAAEVFDPFIQSEPELSTPSPELFQFNEESAAGSFQPPETVLSQETDWFVESETDVQHLSEAPTTNVPQASALESGAAASPFQQVIPPPIPSTAFHSGLNETGLNESSETPELPPQPEFSGPLEREWHDTSSDVTASAIQPSLVSPPAEFSLSDIQILGVCPLFADRRLLVVSSNGLHALMGQVGLQQPQVAVLKLFDHNPLAYQNTFTAVAEAHADSQGIFVTQVGTWRGIISTFQDKITLHTDLG